MVEKEKKKISRRHLREMNAVLSDQDNKEHKEDFLRLLKYGKKLPLEIRLTLDELEQSINKYEEFKTNRENYRVLKYLLSLVVPMALLYLSYSSLPRGSAEELQELTESLLFFIAAIIASVVSLRYTFDDDERTEGTSIVKHKRKITSLTKKLYKEVRQTPNPQIQEAIFGWYLPVSPEHTTQNEPEEFIHLGMFLEEPEITAMQMAFDEFRFEQEQARKERRLEKRAQEKEKNTQNIPSDTTEKQKRK